MQQHQNQLFYHPHGFFKKRFIVKVPIYLDLLYKYHLILFVLFHLFFLWYHISTIFTYTYVQECKDARMYIYNNCTLNICIIYFDFSMLTFTFYLYLQIKNILFSSYVIIISSVECASHPYIILVLGFTNFQNSSLYIPFFPIEL